jgi:hypothetical protein
VKIMFGSDNPYALAPAEGREPAWNILTWVFKSSPMERRP